MSGCCFTAPGTDAAGGHPTMNLRLDIRAHGAPMPGNPCARSPLPPVVAYTALDFAYEGAGAAAR